MICIDVNKKRATKKRLKKRIVVKKWTTYFGQNLQQEKKEFWFAIICYSGTASMRFDNTYKTPFQRQKSGKIDSQEKSQPSSPQSENVKHSFIHMGVFTLSG